LGQHGLLELDVHNQLVEALLLVHVHVQTRAHLLHQEASLSQGRLIQVDCLALQGRDVRDRRQLQPVGRGLPGPDIELHVLKRLIGFALAAREEQVECTERSLLDVDHRPGVVVRRLGSLDLDFGFLVEGVEGVVVDHLEVGHPDHFGVEDDCVDAGPLVRVPDEALVLVLEAVAAGHLHGALGLVEVKHVVDVDLLVYHVDAHAWWHLGGEVDALEKLLD